MALRNVDAGKRGVDTNLDTSVGTEKQEKSEKTYRELSSSTAELRLPLWQVGDHERTGGSFVSGECALNDGRIAEILDARRCHIDIEGSHIIAQVCERLVASDGAVLGLHLVRSSLGD